jgi:hypothetical protein
VTPSGQYDPAAARQRYADWKAKQTGSQKPEVGSQNVPGVTPATTAGTAVPPSSKSSAAVAAPAVDFDPEVGF